MVGQSRVVVRDQSLEPSAQHSGFALQPVTVAVLTEEPVAAHDRLRDHDALVAEAAMSSRAFGQRTEGALDVRPAELAAGKWV